MKMILLVALAVFLSIGAPAHALVLNYTQIADNWVNEGSANANSGNDANLDLNDGASNRELMFKFNQSIQGVLDVHSANFCINMNANNLDIGESFNATVLRIYENYTCSGVSWAETCPTWNLRPNSSYLSGAYSSYVFSFFSPIATFYCFDVKGIVNDSSNQRNFSMYVLPIVVSGAPSATDQLVFNSLQHATASLRPYLEVNATVVNPPSYSLNSTNSNGLTSQSVRHNLTWSDPYGLSGYVFSFDNGAGTFTNDTFVSMTGASNISSIVKTATAVNNSNVCWKVFANNTWNVWNVSQTYCYKVYDDMPPLLGSLVRTVLSNIFFRINVTSNDFTGIDKVNISYAGVNEEGDCFKFLSDGRCNVEVPKTVQMTNVSGSEYTHQVLYEEVFNQIQFGNNSMFWNNPPEFVTVGNDSIMIFHFVNNFTMTNGTVLGLDFDLRSNSSALANMNVLIFGNKSSLANFTAGNILESDDYLTYRTISPSLPVEHCHGLNFNQSDCGTANSMHYDSVLVADSTGAFKIGNRTIHIDNSFWVVLTESVASTGNWRMSYRNSSMCNTTQWYIGNSSNWTYYQSTLGCPDVVVNFIRPNVNNVSDGYYAYVCANDTAGNSGCSYPKPQYYFYGAAPNLPPVAGEISDLVDTVQYCPIGISWQPFYDNLGHAISYNVSLLNSTGGFMSVIASNLSVTSYEWDCSSVPDGEYSLKVDGCDNEFCSFATLSGTFIKDSYSSSLMTLDYPTELVNVGDYSVVINYTDGSTHIPNASVIVCYAFLSESHCSNATEGDGTYYFNFSYNAQQGGVLAFNVTAFKFPYAPQFEAFDIYLFNVNFTVRFWQDLEMTQPYLNEFLWVYAKPRCSSLSDFIYLGIYDTCNATYMHSRYSGGQANVMLWSPDVYDIYLVDGSVTFACEFCPPTVSNYLHWDKFDIVEVTETGSLARDYFWNTTVSGTNPIFGDFDMNFWLSVGGLLVLLVVAFACAKITENAIATAFIIVIVYILLKLFGVLTGAIFWIF